jgi:hypothetical protein
VALELVFHPSIPDDLALAIAYYDEISRTLGNRFRDNVKDLLSNLSERPESFPMDVEPIRFGRVERFPYLIFFVPRTSYVSVIATLHGASDPRKWRERSDQ